MRRQSTHDARNSLKRLFLVTIGRFIGPDCNLEFAQKIFSLALTLLRNCSSMRSRDESWFLRWWKAESYGNRRGGGRRQSRVEAIKSCKTSEKNIFQPVSRRRSLSMSNRAKTKYCRVINSPLSGKQIIDALCMAAPWTFGDYVARWDTRERIYDSLFGWLLN